MPEAGDAGECHAGRHAQLALLGVQAEEQHCHLLVHTGLASPARRRGIELYPGQDLETDATLLEVLQALHEVFHTTPQSVKLPHHQHIAGVTGLSCRLRSAGPQSPVGSTGSGSRCAPQRM